LVITHDEEFVRKLGLGGVAETYYRVYKEADEQGASQALPTASPAAPKIVFSS
jgi:hypothetical protein